MTSSVHLDPSSSTVALPLAVRRSLVRRRPSSCLVPAALVLLALAAAPVRPTRNAPGSRSDAPPVQLGESRPLETALGDRSLPTAADVWVDMIRGARERVDLEHFYLSRKPG